MMLKMTLTGREYDYNSRNRGKNNYKKIENNGKLKKLKLLNYFMFFEIILFLES